MNSFAELDNLICKLIRIHSAICTEWTKHEYYKKINFSKKLVIDVVDLNRNPELLETIFRYRTFLFDRVTQFSLILSSEGYPSRIKNQNSIEFKLAAYMNKEGRGEFPLYKCLNDLFGTRYIAKKGSDLEEIFAHVQSAFPQLRSMRSIKKGYKAIHVYVQGGNYNFPWELQIWCAEDEQANKRAHKKYKQDYTKWEKETIKEV